MITNTDELFQYKLSHLEKLLEEISEDSPELQSSIKDLLYPMHILNCLADLAEGVLNNDANSIEQMRYLLAPAVTETAYLVEAVDNLLQDKDRCEGGTNDNGENIIHYGELIIIAVAAGRIGRNPAHPLPDPNAFIEVVKYYALATLPLQAMVRAIQAGLAMDNFTLVFTHQTQCRDRYMQLKMLANTFWDKRDLVIGATIIRLLERVKEFFGPTKGDKQGDKHWNGPGSLHILGVESDAETQQADRWLKVRTDYKGNNNRKKNLRAYYVFESTIPRQKKGFLFEVQKLSRDAYRFENKEGIFFLPAPRRRSGWLHLEFEEQLKSNAKQRDASIGYWEELNESESALKMSPVPLEKMQNVNWIPLIARDTANRWGPENGYIHGTSGWDTEYVHLGDSEVDIIVVRPVILCRSEGKTDGVPFRYRRLSLDDARAHVRQAAKAVGFTVQFIDMPFELDGDLSFRPSDRQNGRKEQHALFEMLRQISESSSGKPDTLWISLVDGLQDFYLLDINANSLGIIAATPARLAEALRCLQQLKAPLKITPDEANEPAITYEVEFFNGALKVNDFALIDRRILAHNRLPQVASQWIALGYSRDGSLEFEERIKVPTENFSGALTLSLPYPHDLYRIDFRYQPELFAIELASLTQPRIAEASVQTLPKSSIFRGSSFGVVTPAPRKKLISVQEYAGSISLDCDYEHQRQRVIWREGHSGGRETCATVFADNSKMLRSIPHGKCLRQLPITSIHLKSSEAQRLDRIKVFVSDGWSSESSEVKAGRFRSDIQARDLLPRRVTEKLYWADIDESRINGSIDHEHGLDWLVKGEKVHERVSPDAVVELPEGLHLSDIQVEFSLGNQLER